MRLIMFSVFFTIYISIIGFCFLQQRLAFHAGFEDAQQDIFDYKSFGYGSSYIEDIVLPKAINNGQYNDGYRKGLKQYFKNNEE